MRVCLLHPFVWPEVRRGGERYLDDLATYLRTRNHDVELVVGTHGAAGSAVGLTQLRHLRPPGLDRLNLSDIETFGLRALPTLARRRRYDIVHALTPSGAVAAGLALHRTIYTVLGHPTRQAIGRRRVRRRLFEAAVRRAAAVTVLSDTAANALRDSVGRDPDVLPPGVFLDRFPVAPEPRSGTPRVLFASGLDRPEKGVGTLLDAFPKVLVAHPDARLELSGPGDPTQALAGVDAALRDRVDLPGLGRPEDMPLRYARAHVTVLPSRNEAFGLVLAESLACGTPAVGTRGGGAEGIIDDDRIGRLVEHGDPDGLAEAIVGCIALARGAQTPARCREHARRWGWVECIGPKHVDLYERVAADRDGVP